VVLGLGVAVQAQTAPYPRSTRIVGVEFDQSTLRTGLAEGSDQFPFTWADDGHLYTAWGDGWGFAETGSKMHMGVSRLEGGPTDFVATDLWGDPVSGGDSFIGKPNAGLVSVDGTLYIYTIKQDTWDECKLLSSTDRGVTWLDGPVLFAEPDGVFSDASIVQFGQDYSGARDGFVYGYGRAAGQVYLFRVPRGEMAERSAYEFFSGTAEVPSWTADIASRVSVFHDPAGVEWGLEVAYSSALELYLLTVRHNGDSGDWGIFEAPEPWGPWATVAYGAELPAWTGEPVNGRPAWMHALVMKWASADGTVLWQASDRGDEFNLVEMTLVLGNLFVDGFEAGDTDAWSKTTP
jgi:hypothetical protein